MFNVNTGFKGRFKLDVKKSDGRIEPLCDWFDNLITDDGLNRLGTGSAVTYCRIGTGTNAPTVGDTALQNQTAFSGTASVPSYSAQTASPYYITVTFTYTFTQGAVVGTMAEIAISWLTTGAGLWCRARIKDGGGSDTTITLVALDQLIVTYSVDVYMNTADVVTTPTIAGVPTTVTIRPFSVLASTWLVSASTTALNILNRGASASVADYYMTLYRDGVLQTITSSSVTGGTFVANATPNSIPTYSSGSLSIIINYQFPIGVANFSNNNFFNISGNLGKWQAHFSPGITKNNTQILSFSINYTWSRI